MFLTVSACLAQHDLYDFGVQRADSLNAHLQMLQTEKHAVMNLFVLSVERHWKALT